jgi:hypothetical protein
MQIEGRIEGWNESRWVWSSSTGLKSVDTVEVETDCEWVESFENQKGMTIVLIKTNNNTKKCCLCVEQQSLTERVVVYIEEQLSKRTVYELLRESNNYQVERVVV